MDPPGNTQWVVVTPRDAALRILEAKYGSAGPAAAGERTFDLAAFQEDAVVRAREILAQRGGVLIADSVGLGKTYIALALAEEALQTGARVAVVAPASLRSLWRAPLRRIAAAHGVRRTSGIGFLEGDLTAPDARAESSLGWISHGRLSRGTVPAGWIEPLDVVVIDEAHNFRNPRTRRYRELARMCRGARVVLLTATPVNNSLMDLYAQIRLFAGDGAFRDLGVPDLRAIFRTAAGRLGSATPALVATLNAVLIRRTRPVLVDEATAAAARRGGSAPQGQAGVPLRFPERAPPAAIRYDLAGAYPGVYSTIAEHLSSLTFAPLVIGAYSAGRSREDGGTAGAELMRITLLKRLESSVPAFVATLRALIEHTRTFLEHLEQGRLFTPSEQRAFRQRNQEDAVQLFFGTLALAAVPGRLNAAALAADATADLASLRELERQLGTLQQEDPKLTRLQELLGGPLLGERVLLFTEFRDTARYLWHALRGRGGVGLVHGGGAFLGRTRCVRRDVVERFSPLSNGARPSPPHEEVRLLIATDVLSEGMNLQDARHVVSYDVPWNPVRLIQRVGRIDRIGSQHDTIFTHVFLPARGLDELLGLLARVRQKLESMRATTGAEPDESLFIDRLARGDPGLLDDVERHEAAPFEAEERMRLAYLRHRSLSLPPPAAVSGGDPPVPAAVLDGAAAPGVLVGLHHRRAVRLVLCDDTGRATADPPGAFQALTAALNTHPDDRDSATPDLDRLHAASRAAIHLVPGEPRQLVLAPGSGRRGVAHLVARKLLGELAALPGGPEAALCARVEKILYQLSEGSPAGLESALSALAASRTPDADPRAFCRSLEMLLEAWQPKGERRSRAATRHPETAVIAALELRATRKS